ncbi:hypothetical protein J5N97_007872 [Dioscorea zingiberensis]|uniref:Uncharacterized protein n=1 Tax=Dioscorea zingiberensis TaxID=325984 RepID=A0A9D5DCN5_9LILI|nr:hypothetical protein J5N97_007872 [Dioscorea zingiberensis]
MAATSSRTRTLAAAALLGPSTAHRRSCACSPTTHPGSYRCSLHKEIRSYAAVVPSAIRIEPVGINWVRRALALAAVTRPSSHLHRRKAAFQPRPSRLSAVSSAADL